MLRAYIDKYTDWEQYLPLILYAYRSAVHSSTGVSPFVLMFGRQPKVADLSHPMAFDKETYQAHVRARFAELQDFVEANMVSAAEHQKATYDQRATPRSFQTGDTVWLSRPTAGKLEPRWEGEWRVKSVKSPCTMEITDGQRTRVVHVNRLRHRVQPTVTVAPNGADSSQGWHPPQVDHVVLPPVQPPLPPPPQPPPEQLVRRYPQRDRQPPNRFVSSGSSLN